MNQLDPLAGKILGRLVGQPDAAEIVLGGYFVLSQYVPYRRTHDIDAWWKTLPVRATEQLLRDAVVSVASEENLFMSERRFGDTLSLELSRDKMKCFSVQIAIRSVLLEPPIESDWPPILMETLSDNIGSKMNALVERGAPRDFVDIRQVIQAGLSSPSTCWELWRRKNPDASISEGTRKVLFHLQAIEARRPLDSIPDSAARAEADQTRAFFREEFLR